MDERSSFPEKEKVGERPSYEVGAKKNCLGEYGRDHCEGQTFLQEADCKERRKEENLVLSRRMYIETWVNTHFG